MKPLKTVKIGRKVVKYYHDNFEYFQPNDHICGDCAIRAVAGALYISWHEALDKLIPYAHKMSEDPTSRKCVGALLEDNGFKWYPIDVSCGGKRPTVSDFTKDNPEHIYVYSVSSHLVHARYGKYRDIWDCGEKPLYGFWEKE